MKRIGRTVVLAVGTVMQAAFAHAADIGAGTTQMTAAKAVLDALHGPDALAVYQAKGLDPG